MIIAEISVVPVGTKTASVSKYVAKAVEELKKIGLQSELTAMGTEFEVKSIEKVLEAFKVVHESVFKEECVRVVTSLKVDERRDKEGSIEQKKNSVEKWRIKEKVQK